MKVRFKGWLRFTALTLSACLMVTLAARVLIAQENFRASPYFQALAVSDRFYREGNLQMAERLASPVKPQFSSSQVPAQPFSDPSRLSGAANVYLRTAREGLGAGKIGRAGEERFIHESKIYEPLQKLTENYPDFLPGHILLAHACEEDPKACRDNSRTDQPRDAVSVMERASALFPDQAAIIKEKIAVLDREATRDDRRFIYWLEAAIAARQFALTYPDDPAVGEFNALAEQNMRRFQRELNRYRLEGRLLRGMAARQGGDTFLALIELGERDYGDQIIAPQMRRRRDLVTDPVLNDYVNQIGHRLARASGRTDLNYEFFIVDDPSINASAYPGGKIIVHKGAILAARSEAELAGLLAHEVAHAALSHGYLRMLETSKLEYFRAIFGRFPIFGGLIGDYFRGAQAEFTRRNEQQADILGTKLLATTPVESGSSSLRYSADGLYGFMEVLRQRSGRTQTGWLDSHPAPPVRVRYLEHLILTNRYNRYAYEGIERHTDIREYLVGGKLPTDIASRSPGVAAAPSPGVTTSAPEPLWGLPTDPDPLPSQPGPAVGDRPAHPVGPIALNISQNNDQVRIEITGAEISPSGSFSLRFTVYNNSRRRFAFVPVYSQVLDANNQEVKARFSLVDSSSGEAFAEPGGSLQAQVQVIGYRWQGQGRQGLSLLIKEATAGGRVFRIAF